MNIFHELAEKAFAKRFDEFGTVSSQLNFASRDEAYCWFSVEFGELLIFYQDMNPEEQALALLFIGEMYESETH